MTALPRPALVLVLIALAGTPGRAAEPVLSFETPPVAARGIELTVLVEARGLEPGETYPLSVFLSPDGESLEEALVDGENRLTLHPSTVGRSRVEFSSRGRVIHRASLRVIPGFLSVLPPLVAILLAIVFRQVVVALLTGVWLGALFVEGFDPLGAAFRAVDRYALNALADAEHASIVLFTLMLGGMVAVISRSGGTHGIVARLRPLATSRRRGQLATWAMGMFVFFDDYANSLLVGNTMRPVTDRLRISREKLAYIVDSTSAPIASVALISTWIGTEVGLIADAFDRIGSEADPYRTFLASIPYRFYPILALYFVVVIAWTRRDFGPMRSAEQRALKGRLVREGAVPLADPEAERLKPPEGTPLRWYNAVIPVLVVLGVTLVGLYVTGRGAKAAESDPLGELTFVGVLASGHPIRNLGLLVSAGDSYQALLWACFLGGVVAVVLAVSQRLLTLQQALNAWGRGIRSMIPAMLILVLAWSLSAVCEDIQTSGYLISSISERMPYHLVPSLVFFLSALVSFATGTSWGTMGILVPLTIPVAHHLGGLHGLGPDGAYLLMLGCISSVLAGATFGDHCSPISDTTILSSMASGSDHVDHVRTQLPYALVVAGASVLLGDIPTAFGLSPWISLVVGAAALYGLVRVLGRPVGDGDA